LARLSVKMIMMIGENIVFRRWHCLFWCWVIDVADRSKTPFFMT